MQLFGLRRTWQFARRNSVFYRDRLPDLDDGEVSFDALARLPVLTKAELSDHALDIYGDHDVPHAILFTGGTTGRPQIIPVTSEEVAIRNATAHSGEISDGPTPLTLITGGGSQGRITPTGQNQGTICVPLRSRTGYEWAWRMLVSEHRFRGAASRVTRIALPLPAIKKLVNFAAERGLDRTALAVETVLSFSSYISKGWRKRIEEFFDARLVDCYGFTEAPVARALQSDASGYFHMPEGVIAEFLELDGTAPVDSGFARMCVTTLYPQTQSAILIRYDPGDIVQLGPVCPQTGTRGFLPKGRRHHSVAIQHNGRTIYPIFATDIQEAVDIHHWVARSSNLRHGGVTASEDDSWPKWRLSPDHGTEGGPTPIRVEIELTSSPAFFHEEWNILHDHIHCTIMEENPTLGQMVAAGMVQLNVCGVPPGTIAENEIIRC